MLRKEFYELVGQLEDYEFTPYLDHHNQLRFQYVNGHCYCPVTAVCMMETGEHFATYRYYDAARKLKLRKRDAETIAHSSDELGDKASEKVRAKLLKLAGM